MNETAIPLQQRCGAVVQMGEKRGAKGCVDPILS